MTSKQKSGIIVITLLLFFSFSSLYNLNPYVNTSEDIINSPLSKFDASWDLKDVVSGFGDNLTVDLFCENDTAYTNFSIQNSFLDFDHEKNLTLPSIPGYKIYKVNVTLDQNKKITALTDYYSVTVNKNTSTIVQGGGFPNFEAVGQEFSLPYRSYLNNASIYMAISGLVAGNNGSFQLRNNSASGPILNSQVIPVVSLGVPTWHNFTYGLILKGSGQAYEVIINGSNLALMRQYIWYRPAVGSVFLDADVKFWTLGWANAQYNFTLIYNYLPINETGTLPRNFTAEETSLKINNVNVGNDYTIVVDDTDITQLQFSTNISCQLNSMKLRIYYIRENQSVQTTYNAVVNQPTTNWNVTINNPFVSNCINSTYGINITVPSDWTVQTILNGSTLTTYDAANWFQTGNLVSIKNASSGSDPWLLNCTAPNYLNQITVEKKTAPSTYVNITGSPIVNITETIRVNCTLISSMNTGDGNLTIFDPADIANHSQVEAINPPSNGLITFNDWDVWTNATTNGTYTIQVIWFNGTEVGIRNILLSVIHHTNSLLYIEDTFRPQQNPALFWFAGLDNIINITIYYNRTFQTAGISTTNATYNIMNQTGGLWQSWTDMERETLGTGFYNVSLNVTTWSNGRYYVGLNLNLSGYLPQIRNITIDLVYNTTITLIEPSPSILSTYYPENLTIALDYTRIGVGIVPDATVEYYINGGGPQTISFNGSLYEITLNSTALGVGDYDITIIASKFGHFTRQVTINWTILVCPTSYNFYVNGTYSLAGDYWDYHYNDAINISVYYNDTEHGWPIINAPISLTEAVLGSQVITSEGNGWYTWIINTSIQEGLWNLSMSIEKPNYYNYSENIEIYVRYNTTIIWLVKPPPSTRPGDTLGGTINPMEVNVTRIDGTPIVGQNITFRIITNTEIFDYSVLTQLNGSAKFAIEYIIKSDVTSLTIQVLFAGNITYFASSISFSIRITGGFIEEYWWVFVLIAVAVVVILLVVRARRKAVVAKEMAKKEILTSFQDVTKILHLVVIHKGTGADIFDYKIQERLDPTLLAGFIQAVKDFGRQLDQEEQ